MDRNNNKTKYGMVDNSHANRCRTGECHEQQLDALAAISRLLAECTGHRPTLVRVLDVLEERLDMHRATVMLLSPEGGELVVAATRDRSWDDAHDLGYRCGEGVTGVVAQTGRPAIIPRLAADPQFRNRIHRRPTDQCNEFSFVCVPVVLGSESIGTLSVDLPTQPIESLHKAARFLEIVASLIAFDVKSRQTAKLVRQNLEHENLRLRSALEERFRPENIIGNSKGMRDVYLRIHQVANSHTTVLIRGESGTGKELVASAIHYSSARSAKPFVKVNCAALSESLLESELFGHEKGAFTGALYERIGRMEEADGGTFFLDEIGDFSPAIQVKLLRVLQEREFERVGSNKTRKVNVRVIAATNRDLESLVEQGRFRQDLYYRINVVPVFLPPLRERRNDILLLADHFVGKYATAMKKNVRRISTPAINMMFAYHWPGNVRELENCIEHAVLMSSDDVIHGHHLPPTLQMPESGPSALAGSLRAQVDLLEKDLIVDALKCAEGNMSAAARQLGITPRMIRYKISKLGIDFSGLFTTTS